LRIRLNIPILQLRSAGELPSANTSRGMRDFVPTG
jgi:hypothetical protein